jgi:hypothetical protein
MYEYIYVEATMGGFFTDDNHQEIINQYASQGWRLVQVLPAHYNGHGTPTQYEIIFERKVDE